MKKPTESESDMFEIEYDGADGFSLKQNDIELGQVFFEDAVDMMKLSECRIANLLNPVDLFSVKGDKYNRIKATYNDGFFLVGLDYITSESYRERGFTYIGFREFFDKLDEKIKTISNEDERNKLLSFSMALRYQVYFFFDVDC